MDMNTFIKTWRSLLDHDIIRDPNAFLLFSVILLSVDYQTGKRRYGRFILAEMTEIHPSTIYKALKRLEKKYNVISCFGNNKNTEISVLNWSKYQGNDDMVTTREQQGNNKVTHIKNIRSKEYKNKEREIKRESSINYLDELPDEDTSLFYEEYEASRVQIKDKARSLADYCRGHGKKYTDYKAMLRNALRRDFKRRVKIQPIIHNEPEMSEEQRLKNLAILAQMRSNILRSPDKHIDINARRNELREQLKQVN